jgi:hypothetical protein
MRVVAIATVLLLSSSLGPSFAQGQSDQTTQAQSTPGQPQTAPVQPERTPQQSEQSRGQDQKRGEDVQVGRDWRTQSRDGDMGRMTQSDMLQMMERMARSCQNVEHMMEQMHAGMRGGGMDQDQDRGYANNQYQSDRTPRRSKVCIEYQNGDQLCRFRD